jgi:hypothetical protein
VTTHLSLSVLPVGAINLRQARQNMRALPYISLLILLLYNLLGKSIIIMGRTRALIVIYFDSNHYCDIWEKKLSGQKTCNVVDLRHYTLPWK